MLNKEELAKREARLERRRLAKLERQMKKQKNKARNQRLFRLKRPNVVYQSNIAGVYVDIKEAVENEKKQKKIMASLRNVPSGTVDKKEPKTQKQLAGYVCIKCHDQPALKDNGGLCENCGKGFRNPEYPGLYNVKV